MISYSKQNRPRQTYLYFFKEKYKNENEQNIWQTFMMVIKANFLYIYNTAILIQQSTAIIFDRIISHKKSFQNILSTLMIKQSQIGNFVSLIKSLKKRLNNDKTKISTQDKKSRINCKSNQNVNPNINHNTNIKLKTTSNINKRVFTSKDRIFETIKNFHPFHEESFAQFKFDKRPDILQRKKIYQLYCEEKKNKAETTTRGRVNDVSVEVCCRSQQIKFPHRRSNTNLGNPGLEKKISSLMPDKIQKQQNLLNLQIIKNQVQERDYRLNNRQNLSKSYLPISTSTCKRRRETQNYLVSRTSKTRLKKQKPNQNSHKKYQSQINNNHNAWIIDAWEQPMEIAQEIMYIRHA